MTTAWPVQTNANLLFDEKKNRKMANIRPSLHFYGMIFWWKKGLCRGMAWLPFQKHSWIQTLKPIWNKSCLSLCVNLMKYLFISFFSRLENSIIVRKKPRSTKQYLKMKAKKHQHHLCLLFIIFYSHCTSAVGNKVNKILWNFLNCV